MSGSGAPNLTGLVNTIQQGNQILTQILAALRAGLPNSTGYNFGTISFGAGRTAAAGTITLTENQPVLAHITSVFFSNGSSGGSITASVQINGVAVTGLSAVVINGTGQANASGLNAVAAGSVVTVVFSSPTGTISDGGAITVAGVVG